MNLTPPLWEWEENLHTLALSVVKTLKGRSDSHNENSSSERLSNLLSVTQLPSGSQAQPRPSDPHAHGLPTFPSAAVVVASPGSLLEEQQPGPDLS